MVPVDGNNPSRPISQPRSPDIVVLGPEENPIDGFDQEGSSIPTVVLFGGSPTLTSTASDLTEQPYHGTSMTNSSRLIHPVFTAPSNLDSSDSTIPVTSTPSSLSIFPVSTDFLDVGLLPAAADAMSVFPQPTPPAETTPPAHVIAPTLCLTPIQALFSKSEFKKFRHQLCDKGIWHLEQLTNNANTHLCTWDVIKARLQCRSRTPMWYSALRHNICAEEPDNFIQVTFANDNHTPPTHLTIDNDKLTRLKGNMPSMPPLITISTALSTVGGVHADHYSVWLMRTLAMEPKHPDELQIYTDGSLINMGTKDIPMTFSAVRKNEPSKRRRAVAGRIEGYASSTKAELMGLLAAIQTVAPDQD
ncbi:hypothetical protein BGZ79_005283, partial [Entomortierella chlamydospora]